MPSLTRQSGLDLGRGLAVLLIFLLHAGTAMEYAGAGIEAKLWQFLSWTVAPLALPAFFFLSGFFTFQSQTRHTFGEHLCRRVKQLAVPFFAWNALCLILFLGAALFFSRIEMRVAQFGLDTISGITSKLFNLDIYPLVQPLWYLRALFILSIAMPCFRWIYRSAGASLLFLLLTLTLWEGVLLTVPAYAVATFFLGGWFAHAGYTLHALVPWRWGLLGLTLLFLVLKPFLAALLAQLLFILTAPTLWAFAVTWRTALRNLPQLSFFLYAGHFLFSSTLLHLMGPRLSNTPGILTFLAIAYILGGAFICTVTWNLGRRLCSRILRLFDGSY